MSLLPLSRPTPPTRRVSGALLRAALLAGILLLAALLLAVLSSARGPVQANIMVYADLANAEKPARLQPLTRAEGAAQPAVALPPSPKLVEDDGWRGRYELWQGGLTAYSGGDGTPLIHGREDVLAHAKVIRLLATKDLELILAASIAHQASDLKDRPFGSDLIEELWLTYVDPDASVGIAQLRPNEAMRWEPTLTERDLLTPTFAIRIMSAKLTEADRYLRSQHQETPPTDRYMLLALAQNTASPQAMHMTIDYFFGTAGRDWQQMLASELARQWDWQEQLRLVVLHWDWLVATGWLAPPGVDINLWRQIAFSS